MLQVVQLTFNPFQENTFIVTGGNGNCIVIDPGCYTREEQMMLSNYISRNSLTVQRLINTHCHIDHVLGNAFVSSMYDVLPEYHSMEQTQLNSVQQYAHLYGVHDYHPSPAAVNFLNENDSILLDGSVLKILYVPGHSPGHIALYSEDNGFIISGDVLFCGSVGRTDLPGGNFSILEQSIRKHLYTLPEHTLVYCGHGSKTSIGDEKHSNPFVSGL
jgi:glyoxylase-like metal-dependent hydrolase (beta-lactamase superfamily II)